MRLDALVPRQAGRPVSDDAHLGEQFAPDERAIPGRPSGLGQGARGRDPRPHELRLAADARLVDEGDLAQPGRLLPVGRTRPAVSTTDCCAVNPAAASSSPATAALSVTSTPKVTCRAPGNSAANR